MSTALHYEIAPGDPGVRETVAHMARIIREGVADPAVRRAAIAIVGGLDPAASLDHIYAIREFLAAYVRFVRDPVGVELLHTPAWMLADIAEHGVTHGDCDDVAILGGALAGAVGLRVALVTVAFLDNPQYLSHVWAVATPPVPLLDEACRQAWIDLDTTRPAQATAMSQVARVERYPVVI